jgi:KDO2-lipid IV(A) lauroyltransferase
LGERWSLAQWIKNTLIYWVIRSLLLVVDHLPAGWLTRLGRRIGKIAYFLFSEARIIAVSRIERALPGSDARKLAQRCFVQAGENAAICLLLRRAETRALDWVQIDDEARAIFDGAQKEGRGVVFASAHLGPFELIPAAVAELGYRPAIVVRSSYDPRLNRIVDHHRLLRGIQVIPRRGPQTATLLLSSLRANQPLGLLVDLCGRIATREVEILGHRARIARGPEQISQRAKAPLLFGTLHTRREARGPRFSLHITNCGPGGPGATQRVKQALERAVLRDPAEWLWMAPVFGRVAEGWKAELE